MILRIIAITYFIFMVKAQFCNVLAASNGFQNFEKSCNKTYSDETERSKRKNIFQDNCRKIKEMIKEGLQYKTGSNCNSDMQMSEIVSQKLPVPPAGLGKSFASRKTNKYIQSALTANSSNTYTNWQDLGMITPIKDQQYCGSCWAFSTTALVQSVIKIYSKQEYDLSQEYTLQCTDYYAPSIYYSSDCSGGYVDFALDLQVNNGLPQDSVYPYLAAMTSSGRPSSVLNCFDSSVTYRKMDFNSNTPIWSRYDNTDSQQIRILLKSSPLVALFYAESTFSSYKGGIYSCPVNFQTALARINHAVLIVGQDSLGNYIIKNSWGTTWGNQGYAIINSTADCGLSAYIYSIDFIQLYQTSTIIKLLGLTLLVLALS